ncbi:5-carboxymethyl-2-hydroxymuconate Delta-isomerase [uncultured Tateyamaria sp.]|uniref:5-carboxymethyl-2-hydroxymuconate Delta-isomerase n=1 Tax=uncultured Tateyamaria sp. TaxID=455651 RepID=UPI00260BDCCC|nr:5-carboxymethyl-2-hydroxymuconate Delta-isomerase [uncultured Tateyamaria sp.]
MPHFQIDYSANLDGVVDMGDLCEHIRSVAAQIDTFPMAGIRVRAVRVDHYAIADGNSKHGFIDISVRLRAGRPQDVKRDATARLFEAARDHLAPVMETRSIALSLEMREIDADLSPKAGTIRDHLEG